MNIVALSSIQYSILIQMDLLKVNIANIHCICILIIPWNSDMNRSGFAIYRVKNSTSKSFLIDNVFNIHCICKLTFPLKLQYVWQRVSWLRAPWL
jgi:hypothetical protein